MKKILFIIDSLGGGGAEKALVNLVNNMDKNKFDITVETMFYLGVNQKFLNSDIKLVSKNAPYFHGVSRLIKILSPKFLYNYFIPKEKFDIIVSFMHGASCKAVSGCEEKDVKKFVWIHCGDIENSSIWKFYKNRKAAVDAFKKFDGIVGVSESVSQNFSKAMGIKNVLTCCNVYETKKITELAEEKNDMITKNNGTDICCVGRLSEEKGCRRLLNVAKKLVQINPNFTIYFIGEGPLKDEMDLFIKNNSLSKHVKLLGYAENPYSIMKECDVYVCPSEIEGMSTTTVEAVILGLAVVSTDVSGAKEILGENNDFGIVCENSEPGLLEALKTMLANKELQKDYKKKSALRAEDFKAENAVKKAENILLR